jgi:threonyl-tRNA synthetase
VQEETVEVSIDGKGVLEVEKGTTARTILELVLQGKDEGKGQGETDEMDKRKGSFAVEVDGQLVDLDYRIEKPVAVKLLGFDSEAGRQVYWHSTSHVLASAVKKLFPETALGIGPAISDGFYYDFDSGTSFTEADLARIEAAMKEIIDADLPFVREDVSKEDAVRIFENARERYKVELASELQDQTISVYRTGQFVDLCRGPHVPSSGWLGAVKLLSVAGAYWRGLEKNPMLQRIYGVSFPSVSELESFLARLKEAERRDHRKLGATLDLFSIQDSIGSGLVLWHPRGAIVRNVIEEFWRREHQRAGYQLIYTPHIGRAELWQRSGHLDYYKKEMYLLEIDEQPYVLKPMNCPGHILIYQSRKRSYRELPIRYAELGTVYRHERSGVLHGMFRVRGFTQDDAHIFCAREQVPEEVGRVIEFAMHMLESFGFREFRIQLSVRDPKHKDRYAGEDAQWEEAEEALRQALERRQLRYTRAEGEAVFYGPKIDMQLLDALGRGWQGTTIQFDFNLPGRFGVTYVGPDGKEHPVVMIHRTLLGALERFTATLIEHYAGEFPLWLAPVQAVVVTVSSDNAGWAAEVVQALRDAGVRVEPDFRDETIGSKIRDAELQKIPYVLVVGKREVADKKVSVRSKKKGQMGVLDVNELKKNLLDEIARKI